MAEFVSITTIEEFRLLDDGEIMEGYLDGVSAMPAPGSDRSRAYWHGWRNGRVDAGLAQPDAAQIMLADAFSAIGP